MSDASERFRAIPTLTGTSPVLDLSQLPTDPVILFHEWLDAALAAGVAEPLAMVVATVDAAGLPDARALILKDIGVSGWAFAGRRSSGMGMQLSSQPAAALNFWWQPIVRAVRVRGSVREASRDVSEADWAARSPAARADVDVADWVQWQLEPARVEFWQGSPDRRHHRIAYAPTGTGSWRFDVHRAGPSALSP